VVQREAEELNMQIVEVDDKEKTVADLTHLEGVGPHVKVVEQDAAKGKDVVVKLGDTEATLVSAEYSDASAELTQGQALALTKRALAGEV
jgi:hypothetical protein